MFDIIIQRLHHEASLLPVLDYAEEVPSETVSGIKLRCSIQAGSMARKYVRIKKMIRRSYSGVERKRLEEDAKRIGS
jgi:hypothetical protein